MVIDKINLKDITDKILKKYQSENTEEIKKLAGEAQSARNTLRTFNKQPIDSYRDTYVPLMQYTSIIPWGTKDVDDQVKTGFTYAYSRANTQSIGGEATTAIDILSCLYNCMAVSNDDASSEQDMLQKVRELIKTQFYVEKALTYISCNKSLLYNISELYGEQFFLICKNMIEGQRYECQAILRSQKNDVIADDGSCEQFLGLMTSAKDAYTKVQKLGAGMSKSLGMQEMIDFAKNRCNSVTCVMLYVSGAHLATLNPGQAIKDLLTAFDLKSEHVDNGTINQMMMPLWQVQGVHPSPQTSQYKPVVIDVQGQFSKYNLEFDIPKSDIVLLPQKMIPIYQKIKQGIISKLTETNESGESHNSLKTLEELIANMESLISDNKIQQIIFKCKELHQQPQLRERLIKGCQFDVLIKSKLEQAQKLQNNAAQIVMADQDNIQKYGTMRWNSKKAIDTVNSQLKEVNQIIQTLENTQNCVDFLKQYHDDDFDKLFAFCKNCQSAKIDDALVDSVNQKLSQAKKKIQAINDQANYEDIIKINDIYVILKDYEFDQKKLDPTIKYVTDKLQQKGIITQKNQDFTSDIQDLKAEQQKYLSQYNISPSDAQIFETQIQMINNFLITLQSGESFIESLDKNLSNLKDKIKDMVTKYRSSVQTQWDDFVEKGKMMDISVE